MKKSILQLFFILSIIIFISGCANSQTSEFIIDDLGKKENTVQEIIADDINTIIQQKDYTLLFFYTTWCIGSHYTLENLNSSCLDAFDPDNVDLTIAIIGLAKNKNDIEQMTEKYGINYVTYYLNSSIGSGMDKVKINRTLKKIIKGYSSVNFVPVSVLCDKNHQIISEPSDFGYNEAYYRVYLKK